MHVEEILQFLFSGNFTFFQLSKALRVLSKFKSIYQHKSSLTTKQTLMKLYLSLSWIFIGNNYMNKLKTFKTQLYSLFT